MGDFPADLRASLALWRGGGALVVLIAGAAALLAVVQLVGVASLSAAVTLGAVSTGLVLLQIGLAGATRVWYSRRVAGKSLPLSETAAASARLLGRFLLLGLLYVVTVIGFGLAASLALVGAITDDGLRQFVASFVGALVANWLFTFAPAYLALVEPRVLVAFSRGRQLAQLPSSRAYKAIPAAVAALLAALAPVLSDTPGGAALALVSPLATLLLAGPTTLFLLRHESPVG